MARAKNEVGNGYGGSTRTPVADGYVFDENGIATKVEVVDESSETTEQTA